MRGVIVGWVPTPYPPPNKMTPPLIIASKCPCPYANRISEALRIYCVHKSMFLQSTTKPPILGGLTKNHVSEAFRIDVHKLMFLRSTTKPPTVSIRGRFDQQMFVIRGVIVPPSKLIVTNICSPQGFVFVRGG